MTSKLYGVNATIIILVFALYCIVVGVVNNLPAYNINKLLNKL